MLLAKKRRLGMFGIIMALALPTMLEQLMLVYAIADAEDIVIDKKAVDKQVDKMVEQYNREDITADYINDYYAKNYGDYYLEYITAYENVIEFLYENAKIK